MKSNAEDEVLIVIILVRLVSQRGNYSNWWRGSAQTINISYFETIDSLNISIRDTFNHLTHMCVDRGIAKFTLVILVRVMPENNVDVTF